MYPINIKYINFYLFIIFIFSVFYLFEKHTVGNDSTISEWIINYEGGFTKRGIIGQISIILSNFFEIKLRESILILQIILVGIYYLLLRKLLINLKINKIFYFAIFSPIFILYPVAEIEVLARKEYFIFISFLIFLFIKKKNIKNFYKIIILPINVLVWEPVLFFFPFWLLIDYVTYRKKKIINFVLKELLKYLPAIILGFYIAINPISESDHAEMATFLKENFNENCYMSCSLLLTKSSLSQQFLSNYEKYSLLILLRYGMIILVGFFPLLILINYIAKKKFFIILSIIFVSTPIAILFSMMSDWGRTVNMYYTFSILTFLFLYKNNLIIVRDNIENNFFNKLLNNKKIFIILFIIFSFGWNPKTSLTGDVASKPGYQIPRKALKIIYFKYLGN
jgi:hypothetical protein